MTFKKICFFIVLGLIALETSPVFSMKYSVDLSDHEVSANCKVAQSSEFDAMTPLGVLYRLPDGRQRIASCAHGFATGAHYSNDRKEYTVPTTVKIPTAQGDETVDITRIIIHPLFFTAGTGARTEFYGVDLMFYDLAAPMKNVTPMALDSVEAKDLVGITVHLFSRGIIKTPSRTIPEGTKHIARSPLSQVSFIGLQTTFDPLNKDTLHAIAIPTDSNSLMARHTGKEWVAMGIMVSCSDGTVGSFADYLVLRDFEDFLYQ